MADFHRSSLKMVCLHTLSISYESAETTKSYLKFNDELHKVYSINYCKLNNMKSQVTKIYYRTHNLICFDANTRVNIHICVYLFVCIER